MKWAMAWTDPLSSMSFPNSAPSRNIGKNCAMNCAALPIKVCVQWASRGSPARAAAKIATAGARRSTLHPRNDSHIRMPRATRIPARPMSQTCCKRQSLHPLDQLHRAMRRAHLALVNDVSEDIARHLFWLGLVDLRQIVRFAATCPRLKTLGPGIELPWRIAGLDLVIALLQPRLDE